MTLDQLLPSMSILLATLLAAFYLWRRGRLSPAGVKRQWKSLSALYGATLGLNFLLLNLILPANSPSAAVASTPALATPTATATAPALSATATPTRTPTLAPAETPTDVPPLLPLDTPDPNAILSCH